jgi:hypothetical protein
MNQVTHRSTSSLLKEYFDPRRKAHRWGCRRIANGKAHACLNITLQECNNRNQQTSLSRNKQRRRPVHSRTPKARNPSGGRRRRELGTGTRRRPSQLLIESSEAAGGWRVCRSYNPRAYGLAGQQRLNVCVRVNGSLACYVRNTSGTLRLYTLTASCLKDGRATVYPGLAVASSTAHAPRRNREHCRAQSQLPAITET